MRKLKIFMQDWRNQSSYFTWLMQYAKPYIPKITLMLILQLVETFLSVGLAVIAKNIIDSTTKGEVMKWAFIVYIGFVLVNQSITIVSSLLAVMLDEKFSFGIRKQIYEKIINSHWMEIKSYHTGDLMTRLTSDAGIIADGIVNVIPTIIRLMTELFLTFGTLFYYEPRLALFSLVLAPVAALMCFFLGKKLKVLQVKVQESEAAYRSFMQESLSNLLIVKAFTNEKYATQKLTHLREERFFWVFKKNKFGIMSSTVLSLSFQFGYIGAFTIGAFQLARNLITYGTMSIFLTLVNRIQVPIISMAQMIPKIVATLASTGRIIELQNIPIEEKVEHNMESKQVGVQVDNLVFGYSKEKVLEDTTFTIRPGEVVAIVGESGIGKTTLVRLIMSFMSNKVGSILFWNQEGETQKANAGTRGFISYVPQGNSLFSGTIRENICMGKLDASEEEITESLKIAVAYSFVNELPEGIETVIGEKGHGLSEGQAQRIAIARALIRKSPFLILDEATSALDEKTELMVLEGITELTPRPTCLLITHRRSVLQYCDRELFLEDKKVQEVKIVNCGLRGSL